MISGQVLDQYGQVKFFTGKEVVGKETSLVTRGKKSNRLGGGYFDLFFMTVVKVGFWPNSLFHCDKKVNNFLGVLILKLK